MLIYTKSFKQNRKIYKKASFFHKIMDFIIKYEKLLTIIFIIFDCILAYLLFIAFSKPVFQR